MQSQTLFVIGAGASSEADLPVALGLAGKIADRLDIQVVRGALHSARDPEILDVLQQFAHGRNEINAWLDAVRVVREGVGYANSIDSFLNSHKDSEKVQYCGKLAIARTILEAEQRSFLYIVQLGNDFKGANELRNTWYVSLIRNLADGVEKKDVEQIFQSVSFIVFNYDRCIEHFLFHALKKFYGIDDEHARSVMSTLKIYHPYGAISPLPWQSVDGTPFGFGPNRKALQQMVSYIKTYTEQIKDTEILNKIHNEVQSAATIVFLGFSYHPENMKLLDPSTSCAAKQVFGTAWGFSEINAQLIKETIASLLGTMTGRIHMRNDLKCSALLQEYSRLLFIPGRARGVA